MARFTYLDKSDVPAEYRDQFRDINLTRLLFHSPRAALSRDAIAQFIRFESRLDPRLRELAIVQVAFSTRSVYAYTHHVKIGFGVGVSEDDVRAVATESAGGVSQLEPLARAVLTAAREMTFELAISDATMAALRESLNDELLIDLMCVIAFYTSTVRLLASLKIDLEPGYAEYLERFPFSAS